MLETTTLLRLFAILMAFLPFFLVLAFACFWIFGFCSYHRRWFIKPNSIWVFKGPYDPFDPTPKYYYKVLEKRGNHLLTLILDQNMSCPGSQPESQPISHFLTMYKPLK